MVTGTTGNSSSSRVRPRPAGIAWLLAALLLTALLGLPWHQAHAFADAGPVASDTAPSPCGSTDCTQVSGCHLQTRILDTLPAGQSRTQTPVCALLPAAPIALADAGDDFRDVIPDAVGPPPDSIYLTTSRLRL